ncbi:MAG: MJ0307 family thioredoxin [Methanobacteriaceae archaeon]|jgi:small redox-active disulfide protein 1
MVVKVEVFTSPLCPYCPMAIKVVDEVKIEMYDDIEVEKIDIMKNQAKANEYRLTAVPAVAINGVVKFFGAPSKEELKRAIKEEIS